MTPIIPERAAELSTITLKSGAHPSYQDGACVMEVVAHLAGEPHSDRPACACPVVAAFARSLNDRIRDDATRTRLLLPLVLDIAGSRSTHEVERKRGYVAADYAVRVFAPIALEARGCHDLAARLRAVAPLVDVASAEVAQTEARATRKIAAAAASAYAAAAAAAYAAAAARLGIHERAVECLRAMLAVR